MRTSDSYVDKLEVSVLRAASLLKSERATAEDYDGSVVWDDKPADVPDDGEVLMSSVGGVFESVVSLLKACDDHLAAPPSWVWSMDRRSVVIIDEERFAQHVDAVRRNANEEIGELERLGF